MSPFSCFHCQNQHLQEKLQFWGLNPIAFPNILYKMPWLWEKSTCQIFQFTSVTSALAECEILWPEWGRGGELNLTCICGTNPWNLYSRQAFRKLENMNTELQNSLKREFIQCRTHTFTFLQKTFEGTTVPKEQQANMNQNDIDSQLNKPRTGLHWRWAWLWLYFTLEGWIRRGQRRQLSGDRGPGANGNCGARGSERGQSPGHLTPRQEASYWHLPCAYSPCRLPALTAGCSTHRIKSDHGGPPTLCRRNRRN